MTQNQKLKKNRITLTNLFLILLLAWQLPAPGSSLQKTEQIKTDKNVPTVINPLNPTSRQGQPIHMHITEDLRIGTVKGGDEYMFGDIRQLAVDDDGQIFVLDTKKTLINVYDKNGLYKKTVGRHGQGPGELQAPQRMFKTWQDEIFVEDHASRSFIFYTLDGLYSRRVSYSHVFIFTTGIDSQGNIIGIVQTP
jgi:hypothetical protein